jgi:hypothetical protein
MSALLNVTLGFIAEAYAASLLFFYLVYRGDKRQTPLTAKKIFLSSLIVSFLTGITRMIAGFLFGGDGIVKLSDSNLTLFMLIFPIFYSIAVYMYWGKLAK